MDDYETISKIGDGSFGTVYLCKRRASKRSSSGDHATEEEQSSVSASNKCDENNLVAIKKMKKKYYNWEDCMKLREIRALKKLKHKNIVLLEEVVRENNHLYLVFEHMEENLYQMIRSQTEPFKEPIIKDIMRQVLNGLAYIHRHGFFHRDIKPENLLCRNGSKSIKIADFGLSREVDSLPPYTDYVSTRWYRAPELLLHSKEYNWTIDIWAVGCISCELYTLQPMFPGRSEIDQIFKICQVIGTPNVNEWPEGQRLASLVQINFPNLVPLNLSDLLTSCSKNGLTMIELSLKWIPSKRPKARDLLAHSFFTEV